MAARAHRDLRRHHLEHIVHHFNGLHGVGSQHAREPGRELLFELAHPRIFGRVLAQAAAQLQHECVVALQVSLHVRQLLALAEQPLREHLLAGKQPLAHAAAEGLVADLCDPFSQS